MSVGGQWKGEPSSPQMPPTPAPCCKVGLWVPVRISVPEGTLSSPLAFLNLACIYLSWPAQGILQAQITKNKLVILVILHRS